MASFLRLFYTEKIVIEPATSLTLSKIDQGLKQVLLKAGQQLERRGPGLTRMMVSKIIFRKFLILIIFKDFINFEKYRLKKNFKSVKVLRFKNLKN